MPLDHLLAQERLLPALGQSEDHGPQHLADGLQRRLAGRPLHHQPVDGGRVLGGVAEQGLLLGGEVVEERAGGHVGRLTDVLHRHLVEAPFGDQPQCRILQRLAGGELLALPPPWLDLPPRQRPPSRLGFDELTGHARRLVLSLHAVQDFT
jgi:hypothetical protein